MRLRRRLRPFLMATLRGSVVALSLLGYLAASIGFPAPAPSADRNSSRDDRSSPCSGGACGCGSTPDSEHCCCCSAKTTPPPPPRAPKSAPGPKPCCAKGCASDGPCPLCIARAILFPGAAETSQAETAEECPFCARAAALAPAGRSSCCAGEQAPSSSETAIAAPVPVDEASTDSDDSFRWVHGVQARHCRGLDMLWYGLAAALPLPPPLHWEGDWQLIGWLTPTSPLMHSVSRTPPAPPPRGASFWFPRGQRSGERRSLSPPSGPPA
jgi:hypothetical protein